MPMDVEVIADAPVVRKVDPATLKAPEKPVVAAPPEPEKKTQLNSMADKLNELLKAKPDAVKPEPEKKTETTKPDEKTEIKKDDEVFTSKKAEDWKKLHARIKEVESKSGNLEKELSAKVAEIEALKKEPKADPKELDVLRGERDKLLSQIETVDLARSPRFQTHYEKLFTEATAVAKEAVGAEHAEVVEALLEMKPNKKRKEMLAQLVESMDSELDKVNLAGAIQSMDRARSERDNALANSRDNLKKLREQEAAEQSRALENNRSQVKARAEAVLELASKELEAFVANPTDEAHNKSIAERQARVRQAFNGDLPDTEVVLLPVLAEEATYLKAKTIPALKAKIAELEASITQLTGATPGAGHGAPNGEKAGDDNDTFIKRFQKEWRGPERKR